MLRVGKGCFVTGFGPGMIPVAEALPGDTVAFETDDCWHGQVDSERKDIEKVDFTSLNPATGPLRVLGASPGDVLSVKISSIRTAPFGAVSIIPGAGLLGNMVEKSATRILPIEGGKVRFGGHLIEARPMIGVIGVATAEDDGYIPTGTPGRHGGNMDTKDICEGATLYLPVSQDGAMLALGDVHAAMGDGEACVTGCEAAAEVTVMVDLIKGRRISWPVIRKGEELMIVVSAETLDRAAEEAAGAAVRLISGACGILWEEAYMLASLAVDLRISQCVDPLRTVRAAIPLSLIGDISGVPEF